MTFWNGYNRRLSNRLEYTAPGDQRSFPSNLTPLMFWSIKHKSLLIYFIQRDEKIMSLIQHPHFWWWIYNVVRKFIFIYTTMLQDWSALGLFYQFLRRPEINLYIKIKCKVFLPQLICKEIFTLSYMNQSTRMAR